MTMPMFVGKSRFAGTISFHNSAVSSSSATITVPASIQNGDMGIIFDAVFDTSSITSVVPTGYTSIGTPGSDSGGGYFARYNASYKVLTTGDSGATVTGMNSAIFFSDKIYLVFRKSAGTWGAFASINAQTLLSGTMNNQTVTVGSAPLVVCGFSTDWTSQKLSMSPAGTYVNTSSLGGRAGYIVYNSSPSNNTVSTTATGGAMGSFYLPLGP